VGNRIWDDLITAEDRAVFEESGHGKTGGLGRRPALLVVDVTHDFTGDRPEPTRESIKRFPLSCGESAWRALPKLRELIDAAHAAGVPVIYTRQAPRPNAVAAGGWARKNARVLEPTEISQRIGNDIPGLIAPSGDDILIEKDKPSAFFGTPIVSHLNALGVDSLIVTGTSTSGCVRATVVDAFSFNYPTVVVEECCFDRGEVSHKVSLFDMNAKYADVISLAAAKALIAESAKVRPWSAARSVGDR
jgi:nicotinamidase-related amidase